MTTWSVILMSVAGVVVAVTFVRCWLMIQRSEEDERPRGLEERSGASPEGRGRFVKEWWFDAVVVALAASGFAFGWHHWWYYVLAGPVGLYLLIKQIRSAFFS